MTPTTEIRNAFNRHATEYEQAAKVQHEIGDRLFSRLDYLKIEPRYVLDLGCGPGNFSARLQQYYPKAQIIGLDLAMHMLNIAKLKQGWWKKWPLVNGDMTRLPFASGIFDLVFANQVIHWSNPLFQVMQELNRVMNTQGCLMFSTLGPDTFKELRLAFQSVDEHAHVNDFADMHDVGDCLLQSYFIEPVVDMEVLTAHYTTISALLRSLKAQGVRNIHAHRNRGLTGKHTWTKLEQSMQCFKTAEGKWPVTYEVVYGHAWKGNQRGTDAVFSLADLKATIKK